MDDLFKRDLPTYRATKSSIAEQMLRIDGKPVSFYDYPFQKAIYDIPARALLLKTARQIGKSTLASNFMISESIALPFFKTLYVSPTKEQTSKFSSTRLSKTIQYSPLMRQRFAGSTDNVFLKILSNGAEIILNYATDDPDRIRGVTADRIFLDEVQDMLVDEILPVIKEASANSDYAYETFTGTPKSMENGIQWLWDQSTQTEWVMPCSGCNSWNYVDSVKSIGKKGIICTKCGGYLDPRAGQWYDMRPTTDERKVRLKGFHVPQVILPKNVEVPDRWDRILEKLENYGESKFKNEVLGVSDALGSRMISLEELRAMCTDYSIKETPTPAELRYQFIVGGVDWSGGGTTHVSRTVVWIWGLQPDNRLKTVYYKILPGRNQVEDVRDVVNIFMKYRVQLVCGDAGGGAVANAMLKEALGDPRVYQVQYGSTAKQMAWNGKDRWIVDKTAFIDSFMLLLKRGGVVFPKEDQMREPFDDIMNEFEEVTNNGMGKKVWKHSPTQPDDSLHAMVFAWTAMRILQGQLQLYKTLD